MLQNNKKHSAANTDNHFDNSIEFRSQGHSIMLECICIFRIAIFSAKYSKKLSCSFGYA